MLDAILAKIGLQRLQTKATPALNSVDNSRTWWPIIREANTGWWQRGREVTTETGLRNATLYRCVTLISGDISKMRLKLVALNEGVWSETESAAFSPVLKRPNRFQNRIRFVECWLLSKLLHGNVYCLKQRDARNVVTSLYILDPRRVTPLVAPDGGVYYRVSRDDLSGVTADAPAIPASEVVHDRCAPLYHPLVGIPPLYAAGLAALQAEEITTNSTNFFRNGSRPGGVLQTPDEITDELARRYKASWEENYGGQNTGRVAVLGNGLTYEPLGTSAVDSQLIEQLRWTSETIASAFGVPGHMVGIGPAPSYNNISALTLQYYSQALQQLIESLELCLDEALELPKPYGVECDLDDLLRMDPKSQLESYVAGVRGGVLAPNEARRKLSLPPVRGGEVPFLQMQDTPIDVAASPADASPSDPEDQGDGPLTQVEVQAMWRRHVEKYREHYAHVTFPPATPQVLRAMKRLERREQGGAA